MLILSTRMVHRRQNLETYWHLKEQIPDLVWFSGTRFSLSRSLPRGEIWLEKVDTKTFTTTPVKMRQGDFDVAIIDQSLDPLEIRPSEGSVSSLANRYLDFVGSDRPADLARALTGMGVICLATSRDGICLEEMVEYGGALLHSNLGDIVDKVPEFMTEAARLIRDNSDDLSLGLRVLTVEATMAWAIFNAGKDFENRLWPTSIRGTIAIRATDTRYEDEHTSYRKFIRDTLRRQGVNAVRIPPIDRLKQGQVIGLVDIVDCVRASKSLWFEGPIAFQLANPRRLKKPVHCPSKRRFFCLPNELSDSIGY